jgi:hypothetical protein
MQDEIGLLVTRVRQALDSMSDESGKAGRAALVELLMRPSLYPASLEALTTIALLAEEAAHLQRRIYAEAAVATSVRRK